MSHYRRADDPDAHYFNPVKHGLVNDLSDWPWSTYHRFLREGYYGRQNLLDQRSDFEDISGGE